MTDQTPLLDSINEPADLRKLASVDLRQLADELRLETISAVSETGGHLGAGLGVVELTVGLHYVFNTPDDRIIWDVGHQAYPHKILTGRRDRIRTLRKADGLSGFTKRAESAYDPFGAGHMGITAENLAEKWGLTRDEQDALAVESHRRAAAAIDAGRFKEQIVPIIKSTRKGDITIDTDEHVRPGTTLSDLGKMRPAFKKDGTVTAGNASGINDGAAFLILANREQAERDGHQPMARLVSYALAGVPNHIMGEGPIPASQKALANAGLSVDDMDVIESNEAFAAQALAVAKGLNFNMEKTNPNGGAIALGHPVGCSGAFIATKALYELKRINGRYALVTMCIGGGQGIACVFENL